jgi:hypothetical protein
MSENKKNVVTIRKISKNQTKIVKIRVNNLSVAPKQLFPESCATLDDLNCFNGSLTFAHTTFAQRHLSRDICPYDVCPEGHLPRQHLPRKTFAQKDICLDNICP